MNEREENLSMPGNPRYQPESLQDIFGYDNLMRPVGEIEIANLRTLAEIRVIPETEIELLSPDIETQLLFIRTSEVDHIERTVTKHDILAWRHIAREIVPAPLNRWVHNFLTSYDVLDTARVLQFKRAHQVIKSRIKEVARELANLAERYADTPQIGRTHGQHAIPITVGFWLATILDRIVTNAEELEERERNLCGKISGPVGCHNAVVALGISERCGDKSFEERLLEKVGLLPSPVSTQILPPEPLFYYLMSCAAASGAIGQFGRDGRNLMRTEIEEIEEEFMEKQGGSSTMAQKKNPITFENMEGFWEKTKDEIPKILSSLTSEHQRDLTGSSVARDFPVIVINLVHQLETLLRKNKEGKTFLSRIKVNEDALSRNLARSASVVLAEPMQLALAMAGYPGDAHGVVKDVTTRNVPRNGDRGHLFKVLYEKARTDGDEELSCALDLIRRRWGSVFEWPEEYTGHAREITLQVIERARAFSERA